MNTPQSFPVKCVLFDLDGTLVDTAPDLANALNTLLQQQQKPTLEYPVIRAVVSHGGNALIRLGFNLTPEDSGFEPLRQQFLDLYQTHLYEQSQLFSGMEAVLQHLEQQQIPWGVVTNKPGWLTQPLMRGLQLEQRAACIVSGDTTDKSKPHPKPLFHACEQIGIKPQHCLYIGDAERDIEAGRNAGMKTLVALFGYLQEHEQPETWQADGMINQPQEILDFIN